MSDDVQAFLVHVAGRQDLAAAERPAQMAFSPFAFRDLGRRLGGFFCFERSVGGT